MDYSTLYDQLKTNLTTAGATIGYEDPGMKMTVAQRDYFRNDEDFDVPDDLFAFYEHYDGLSMRWNAENEQSTGGFFNIGQFLDLQENRSENKLWADWYQPRDIARIKKHRILEMIHGMDYYVTIKFDALSNDYQLYYVAEGSVDHGGSEDLPKIPLTLGQYFAVIFGYYGAYSVRHQLHKPEFYENPRQLIPEYEWLEKNIPDFNPPKFNPVS